MIENICLVIAKVADWVISVVSIIKSSLFEGWKSIQIKEFLEVPYSISC
jgi:hypothetical protein